MLYAADSRVKNHMHSPCRLFNTGQSSAIMFKDVIVYYSLTGSLNDSSHASVCTVLQS